jgi:nucleotide-binding universal stress UspA family protein
MIGVTIAKSRVCGRAVDRKDRSMFRKLLVPLDGSDFAEHALPIAASIALQAGAAIQIVRAHSPVAMLSAESEFVFDQCLDSKIQESETAYLDEVVNKLKRTLRVEIDSALVNNFAADALHEQAIAAGADLVVMATHGRNGLSRFWLGSVADALIRRLPMPILLIRPSEEKLNLTTETIFRRILIPLDGSALAEQILGPAIKFASLARVEYTLVRVVEPFMPPPEVFSEQLLEQLEHQAQVYLDRIVERLRDRSLLVKTRVLVNRPVAAAILEEARVDKTSLIALETHGRGGLGRLLLGSVADKVIRAAKVPVLLRRPSKDGPAD